MQGSNIRTFWQVGLAGAILLAALPLSGSEPTPVRTRFDIRQVFQKPEFAPKNALPERPIAISGIETDPERGALYEDFDDQVSIDEDGESVGRATVNGRVSRISQLEGDLPISRMTPVPDADRTILPEPLAGPAGPQSWLDSCCRPCCDLTNDPCFNCCFGQKLLIPQFGAVFLHRSAPRNDVLIQNPFDPSQNINAKNFDPGWGAGASAGLTLLNGFSPGNDLEIRYWGINDWSDQQSVHATGLVTQINSNPPTLVTGAQDVTAKWSSQMQNFEANFRNRHQNSRFVFLGGFRYLELDDRFDAVFVDPAGVLANSALHVHTRNRLYGFQTGTEYSVYNSSRACLRLYSKGGIFGNATANSDDYRCNCIPPETHRANENSNRLSFLSELGVTGRVSCGRGWFLTSQYQAIWLSGVSTATDQLSHTNFNTGTGMISSGGVFYHGGTVGFERAF
ncbi:MAG: hypothetical protein JWM11_3295 [Planctomycetaceae bacterium]|nr:hypothetical protein [Planctomycetaceae bacterium]